MTAFGHPPFTMGGNWEQICVYLQTEIHTQILQTPINSLLHALRRKYMSQRSGCQESLYISNHITETNTVSSR